MKATTKLSLLLCLLCLSYAGAQPRFDVVSVKPGTPGGKVDFSAVALGRFHAANVRLMSLIYVAYQVLPFQVSGYPQWVDTDVFDIDAKSDHEASAEDTLLMLQSLLADRFHLTLRHTTSYASAYELVVADGKSSKLTPADGSGCAPANSNRPNPCEHMQRTPEFVFTGDRVSMDYLCAMLGILFHGTVVDKTGLEGVYNYKLDASRVGIADELEQLNAVSAALQEQLGLKLRPTKTAVVNLVIERVERPAAN